MTSDITSIFVLIILVVIICNLYRSFSRSVNYWKRKGVKGPTPLPVFGNLLDLLFKPLNVIEEERLLQYGPIYGTMMFTKPVLTIADPTLVREVTIKSFQNFMNRRNQLQSDKILSSMMMFKEDDQWRNLRSILSVAFTSSKLKKMFRDVEDCCDNTIKHLYSTSTENREVTLKDISMALTFDVTAKCVFGVKTNGFENPNSEVLKQAHKVRNFKGWRCLTSIILPTRIQRMFNLTFLDQNSANYFINLVQQILKERRTSDVEFTDFVSILLKNNENDGEDEKLKNNFDESNEDFETRKTILNTNNERKSMTDEEIISTCFLFLFAGTETTSSLLNFTFYEICKNEDIQEELFNEFKEAFGEMEIDYETVNSLPFLDAVISESLRLHTPVVAFDRVAAKDFVLGDTGILIEKGTIINLPFYAVHKLPKFFPEPHSFNPSRFLPENKHHIKPYTFIPFGIGPRNCIGMRFALMVAKLAIVKILINFKILKTENTPFTPDFKGTALLDSKPLFAKFECRQSMKNF